MADTDTEADLLADPVQLARDADLLETWARTREKQGGSFVLMRRAAAALREAALNRMERRPPKFYANPQMDAGIPVSG